MKTELLVVFVFFSLLRVGAADALHLSPFSSFDRSLSLFDGHFDTTYEQLIGRGVPSCHWMIVLPSHIPEYAVVLQTKPENSGFKTFIEVATAEQPIFAWRDVSGSRESYLRKVSVRKISKGISKKDADTLADATFTVLQETRYSRNGDSPIPDGEAYFFCFDRFSGRTFSPSEGKPARLVNAWTALAAYVRAQTKDAENVALERFRSECLAIQKDELTN